jgi:hypothetical protein
LLRFQEPETTTYKAIEAEFTPGPVYYKPLPQSKQDSTPVRSFLKKKDDDFARNKPDGFFRTKLEGFSRPKPEIRPAARTQPEEPKRKSPVSEFFAGFEDRNSDFGDFGGTDMWDKFEQEWGQKVSK